MLGTVRNDPKSTVMPLLSPPVKIAQRIKDYGRHNCPTLARSGFPASGKIRENQGKKILLESQENSGNFALTEVNKVSTLISMHSFWKQDVCQDFFTSLRSAF